MVGGGHPLDGGGAAAKHGLGGAEDHAEAAPSSWSAASSTS